MMPITESDIQPPKKQRFETRKMPHRVRTTAPLPSLSVVTPSYNHGRYIEECIRSVLDQEYPRIEYIVIDGGSSDESKAIIEKYANRLAFWRSAPDKGQYWAIEEGFSRCTGDIMTWLNSDDIFDLHAFQVAVSIFMQRSDVAWITGRPNSMDADRTKFSRSAELPIWSRQRFLDKQYHRPFIQQEGTFWRRSLWEQAGSKMNTQLALAGDMELWTRFFRHARLYSVDYCFAYYRTHGDNRALQFMDRYLHEAESVIENELQLLSEGSHSTILPAAEPITTKQIRDYLIMSKFHKPASKEQKSARLQRIPTNGNDNNKVTIKLAQISGFRFQTDDEPVFRDPMNNESVDVSLILPTKDRASGLEDVLRSIPDAMQDISYEIILYTNKASRQVDRIIESYKIQKVFYDCDVFGPEKLFSWSGLMNHAFAHASGTWSMYASDDIVFYSGCFKQALSLINSLQDASIGAVSFLHRNTVETHQDVFKAFGYDTLNGDKPYINFGLVRTDAFRRTGGFDEGLRFFWADVDICMQLLDAGYRIIPSLQSLVDHNNALEKKTQADRQRLFDYDTICFYEKWNGSKLFGSKNPLEKVRFILSDEDSNCIKTALQSKQEDKTLPQVKKAPHIVIDGVIFQLQAQPAHGISRVWRNIIPALVRSMPQARITVLQRQGFRVPIQGVAIREIPVFHLGDERMLDKDDEMLRRVCRDLDADIFFSTYYTRAPGVPNLLMIHDMIPEVLNYDLSKPEWVAKRRAVETADAFICVSHTTRNDLTTCYPWAANRTMQVVYNGLDACFKKEAQGSRRHFQVKYALSKPYLLLVGNRHGYKSGAVVLNTLAKLPESAAYTILCIGGESIRSAQEVHLQNRLDLRFLGPISDQELTEAYNGARAVLVPSEYEGFGLPIIEAMACGCPVIARKSKTAFEVAGEAACYADPGNPGDIKTALKQIEHEPSRRELIDKGRLRASRFDWRCSAAETWKVIHKIIDSPTILLTAIVSTYNAADYIQGCLEDLEKQTIADRMEIIVVDSASQQDEASTVKAFQRRYPNIKYIRTPRRETVYQAWNRGIKFATGKYVSNANTDDRHRHDAFAQMIQVLEDNEEIALVYADVIKTRTPNETFGRCTPTGMFRWHDWDRKTLLEKGCFIGPQPVWRRSVHGEYGYFSEEFDVSADFEFWLRISQTHEFYHIPKPLGLYMDRPDSVEHANTLRKNQEDQTILDRYRNADRQNIVLGDLHDRQKSTDMDLRRKNETGPKVDRGINTTHTATLQGGHDMHFKEVLLKTVEQLIDGGHKEAALWILGKLVADFPEEAMLHSTVAVLAYEMGQMAISLEHFKSAVSLEPENVSHRKALGDYYYAVEKNAEKALEQYDCLLKVDPNHVQSLIMAGHIALSLHRYTQAQERYQRALDLDPGNAEVRRLLEKMRHVAPEQGASVLSVDELYAEAQVKIREADHSSAIDLLKKLLAQDDAHALAHNDLGVLLYEAGDMQAACTHYERASALQPENEIFQRNLADFYLAAMGDPRRAMETYVQVLKLNPLDVEAVLSCAQICMGMGKAEDSRDFIQAALVMEPWHEDARTLLRQLEGGAPPEASTGTDLFAGAKTKAANGDLQGAIDDLNRYVNMVPDDANAHNDLGVLYFESGEKDKAVSAYERAVHLEPTDATYRKNLADFYLIEQGRIEEAMKLYLSVLEENPQDLESLIACGMITASVGQSEDAKLFYHRALEIEPWNETACEALEAIRDTGDQPSGDGYGTAATG